MNIRLFNGKLIHGGRLALAAALASALLLACSPSTDEGWPPEEDEPSLADELAPDTEALVEDEASPVAGHPVEEVEAVRGFSDDLVAGLRETSIACDLLSPEQLADVAGGEWADGIFRWFEAEVNLAPGALQGICVWQDIEHRTNITLRVYDDSDIAWAAIKAYDEDFSARIHERSLGEGPEIGSDAYRKPHGEHGYYGSCARLDDHIACLTASPRHADEWAEMDVDLLEIIADSLRQ